MLTELFDSATRIQALRDGPCGTLFDAFAQALVRSGYAPLTARRHLRAAEHFAHWADHTGMPVTGPISPALERFNRHLQRAGRCPHFRHTYRLQILHGARLFLTHLQDVGVIEGPAVETTVPTSPLITDFFQWMRQQRGTCTSTLSNYEVHLRELLRRVGDEPATWDARSLRQFVLEGSRTCGWAAAKKRTTALRMFLRFLIAEGRCSTGLDGAIPVLAHWRLSSLPRYLSDDDVERVIASCDIASAVGKRDRAILLLLARLGLRAGDIVQMRLCDIDWKEAWIHVSGKGRYETRLSLSQELGEALIAYLRGGRPQTDTDATFVRSRAPLRAFRSHCAISAIVDRALARAGVTRPSRGAAHLLRHSVATSMLRHGSSLHDVSALLRHRSVATTEIYAKVDITALRTPDGLVIRCSKFRKSRLVPLHETARAGLERYLQRRRAYAPAEPHLFVSLRRKPLLLRDVEVAFRTAAQAIGLPDSPRVRPTPHSLRHTFAVRALQTCPDGRDAITQHMLALSTYLGHAKVADTYWYLEAVPELMTDIADRCERFVMGG